MRPWPLLLAACAAGCSAEPDGYPPHLAYPARTDPLVAAVPNAAPKEPTPAGKLDESIAGLAGEGGKLYFPRDLRPEDQGEITRSLDGLFGSPADPRVGGGPSPALAEGSRLFRRHCAQCHGLSGDGRGPTGLWITPTPRDFRRGAFKFVSTEGSGPRKASREDLLRTLRSGLPGTAMPAFGVLGDETLGLIADYVRHLSLRGEVEYRLMFALLSDEGLDAPIPDAARSELDACQEEWAKADASVVSPKSEPEPGEESVRRGWRLFAAKDGAGCIACHEGYGRTPQPRYDIWGTQVRPGNLTEPVYKGGKRPADLYRRVRCGIAPSGMPAGTALSESQVWDLVRFVTALPYPAELPPDVRENVYP